MLLKHTFIATAVVALSFVVGEIEAYVSVRPPGASPRKVQMKATDGLAARREALASFTKVLGMSALVFGATAAPRRAEAAVGEGGLPEVTEAFQRVLKGQKEWNKVGKTIEDREGKLEDAEWVNTQIFLRNSYMVGEDMRRVVRDAENDKRTQGTAIAKDFQRLTLDMDKPAKSKDYKAFVEAYKQGATYFQNFLDILSDVPDEL